MAIWKDCQGTAQKESTIRTLYSSESLVSLDNICPSCKNDGSIAVLMKGFVHHLLLPLAQFSASREVGAEESHDRVDDEKTKVLSK
jgi:hypothetical protein